MWLVSLISYIDRNTLALLAPVILEETGLTAEQYGYIISAFSIAYMIGNPLWGLILDAFGLRTGMLSAVSFWTFASTAHAFAGGFWSFASARALLGFGEGATFPGGLRTAVQTLPERLRSRGIAVAYSGGSLGAIVTPLLITPIALRFGWRGAFLFTGIIGLAWLLLWMVVSRRLTHHAESPSADRGSIKIRDPRLWAFMASYAFGALPIGFVIYGASIYLSRARGLTQAEIGTLLWIPPLGWELGYFVWGWLADRARRRFAGIFLVLMLFSLPLMVVPATPSTPLVMVGLFFAMFVGAGFIILSVAYATTMFTKEQSGLIAGVGAGSWSAVVGLTMPLFGRMFDRGEFQSAFLLASLFPILGYTIWRAITVRNLKYRP